MRYYHIELCPFSRKLYTLVLPWVKYEYKKLPMRLCNSPGIFQEKMNQLFNGLEYVRTYIDDHINKLDKVLSKLYQKM